MASIPSSVTIEGDVPWDSPVLEFRAVALTIGPPDDGSTPQSENHWQFYAVTSVDSCVRFDMRQEMDGAVGRMYIKGLVYALSFSTVSKVDVPATRGTTVGSVYEALLQNKMHGFIFVREKGCRAWVYRALQMLQARGLIPRSVNLQQLLWNALNYRYSRGTTPTLDLVTQGQYYEPS